MNYLQADGSGGSGGHLVSGITAGYDFSEQTKNTDDNSDTLLSRLTSGRATNLDDLGSGGLIHDTIEIIETLVDQGSARITRLAAMLGDIDGAIKTNIWRKINEWYKELRVAK